MTLQTFFLVLVPTYLVLIAYGVVGARKRPLSTYARLLSAALLVLIPPAAIFAALHGTGDAVLPAGWGSVTLAMLASGIVAAALAWYIAARTS